MRGGGVRKRGGRRRRTKTPRDGKRDRKTHTE